MDNKAKLNGGWTIFSMGIFVILSFAAIVMLILTMVRTYGLPMKISAAAALIMVILSAYYAVEGYKIPHGNLMRYLFLAFAVTFMIESILAQQASMPMTILTAIIALGSAYVAGRLGRYKEAGIIMAIVLIALVVIFILCNTEQPPLPMKTEIVAEPGPIVESMVKPDVPAPAESRVAAAFLGRSGIALANVFSWGVLAFAYMIRYKQHKEAGFDEAPANTNNNK